MQNPEQREQNVRTQAQLAAHLQAAILQREPETCLAVMQQMIQDDFISLETEALPGELEIRMQLHEIIDSALRDVLFADDTPTDTWKQLILPDEHGLFRHFRHQASARWLRLTGSALVDQGLEALQPAALAQLDLRGQALALGRFLAVNDGAADLDYPALAAALDPRLLPALNDWVLCVALVSPSRMHSAEALAKQDALRTSFLDVRRTQHDPLPANSDQASAAYNAPYALATSTRGLAVETNGKQMTALMKRFRPTAEACERLATSDLPVHALEDLPEDTRELVVCPNWSSEHVIYRCMSPLLEGLRDRGVPLMRPFDQRTTLQPVALDWFDQTVDVPNSSSFVLTHLGALCHALRERELDLVLYPEISPANLTYWLATQRFARVQATGYGFPVTTGMRSMDYFVGGADVELPSAGAHYTEQLVLLPGLGVSTTEPPLPTAVRERDANDGQLRLVATTSLNKLNVELLSAWDALLARHPHAQLDVFTNATEPQLNAHLEQLGQWLKRGDVVVHTKQPRAFVMDTLVQADLHLDAFPYGGFNSLVEPLSVGCPVLTLEGELARNRLGAALLRRAELPESVIAKDWSSYVEIAGRLLDDAGERQALRDRLADRAALMARLADHDLAHHMDAALTWMREQGPPKARTAPVLIRAGEAPVRLSA